MRPQNKIALFYLLLFFFIIIYLLIIVSIYWLFCNVLHKSALLTRLIKNNQVLLSTFHQRQTNVGKNFATKDSLFKSYIAI